MGFVLPIFEVAPAPADDSTIRAPGPYHHHPVQISDNQPRMPSSISVQYGVGHTVLWSRHYTVLYHQCIWFLIVCSSCFVAKTTKLIVQSPQFPD